MFGDLHTVVGEYPDVLRFNGRNYLRAVGGEDELDAREGISERRDDSLLADGMEVKIDFINEDDAGRALEKVLCP